MSEEYYLYEAKRLRQLLHDREERIAELESTIAAISREYNSMRDKEVGHLQRIAEYEQDFYHYPSEIKRLTWLWESACNFYPSLEYLEALYDDDVPGPKDVFAQSDE